MNDEGKNKTVLITGASGGIGYELSKIFLSNGFSLIITARNKEKLEQVGQSLSENFKVDIDIIPADLSQKDSPFYLYDAVKRLGRSVDILVNNAGIGLYGRFIETDIETELEMIDLNIRSLTILTKLFVREMVERNAGKILNVSSTAGFLPVPLFSVYGATKSFVLNFSQALAEELRDTKVTVTTLCPGPTKTDFARRGNLEETRLFTRPMNAEIVASLAYKGLMEGKRCVIPGFGNKMLWFVSHAIPPGILAKFTKIYMERKV